MRLVFDPSSDAIPRTAQFVAAANAAVMAAMTLAGDDVQRHTEELLSVPVDHQSDPPTRSAPGEAPRLDTGELVANLKHVVEKVDDGVQFTMTSARPSTPGVPMELEVEMDRPYFGEQNPSNGESSMNYAENAIGEAIIDKLRSVT